MYFAAFPTNLLLKNELPGEHPILYIAPKITIMEFEEYLITKKIDAEAFKRSDAARFEEWMELFKTMHPESFTGHKKFLINEIRRRYHLKEETGQQ
ncbi:hypothetical protein [Dyadobacter sp. MSC1_007]|uniref:hypothetical protein n=1 Tax=Dyadobacter sp. MSC1_007 TaxID=2909264 RepID=UPI00286DC176|nr:hypothetical protein [Dyadobacter sp. MSC1_007]